MSSVLIVGIILGCCVLSVLVMGIIISSLLVHDDMSQADNKLFLALCISLVLVIASDFICSLYLMSSAKFPVNRYLLSLNYIAVNAYLILYSFYMGAYLRRKAYINTSAGYLMVFVSGIITILWTVDVFFETGWFIRFLPNGGFERTPYYMMVAVVPMIIISFDALLVLSFKDRLKTSEILPWVTYAVFPLIASPLAYFVNVSFLYYAEVLAILVVFVYEHSQRQKQAALTEKELANSKMKLMLSQIQPHFMYNSLNSIYYLIEESPEDAQEAVSTFSDYLRQNINSLKSDDPVRFSEELNHTDAYLYLEKVRFGDKLKVAKEINAGDFLIPPLTLQPLVENAVKHGLGPKGGEGTVTVKAYENDIAYIVEVIDDGVGFDAPSFNDRDNTHTHIGLFNVNSRLDSICGAQLNVKSQKGEGTVSRIVLPKEKQKELGKGGSV